MAETIIGIQCEKQRRKDATLWYPSVRIIYRGRITMSVYKLLPISEEVINLPDQSVVNTQAA